jgi:hypothetical protein
MNYPNELIRGITNKDYLDEDGRASTAMFQFDENEERTDDFMEVSINWNDDDGALNHILNQCKKDTSEYQFKIGAAFISKQMLDQVLNSFNYRGRLSYERHPLHNNTYHGNLLMQKNMNKGQRAMIAGSIALCITDIIKREG